MPSEDRREEYRGAVLVARLWKGKYQGKAWSAGSEVATVRGESIEAVLSNLKSAVDAEWRIEEMGSPIAYPSQEEYEKALLNIIDNVPETYLLMLKAHFRAPDRILTARQLARAASYKDWQSANLHYGTLARRVGEAMLFQPRPRKSGEPIWTLVLAKGDDSDPDSEEFRWEMRDELAQALKITGIVQNVA
ncbi:MAG: hypothetical protein RIC85_04690 [Gammaproteobacteria bacterium]